MPRSDDRMQEKINLIAERTAKIEVFIDTQSEMIKKTSERLDKIEPNVAKFSWWEKLKSICITVLASIVSSLVTYIWIKGGCIT